MIQGKRSHTSRSHWYLSPNVILNVCMFAYGNVDTSIPLRLILRSQTDNREFAKRNAAAITQSWTRRRTQGFQSIGKCKCVWDGLQSWCSILVKSRKALKRLSWILLCEWTDPWNSWRCFTAPNSTVASLLLRCFFSLCVHFPQVMTARPRNHRAAPQKPHLAPPPSSVGS